ncbi:DUF2147 domain-containing protein [Pseudovibrio sp. Tun.PSC04-5.I4]|uniref:DUF2147 domain-containing protein n=1 Tax=Pseudovibrio sp. Tun.PSC04-5.I4 TaxID=1798213 RepID=UPI0008812BF8|nr:DUF2147 domain-containing protein [Pseudovibrio sp. Tun.PSC04-5.I4]SDR39705.1 Uncharacterized conserved protein, DUF2147 family [Pseudovibrio sp. Tun.PSC04-5.I4]
MYRTLCFLVFSFSLSLAGNPAQASEISGFWKTDRGAIIYIKECGSALCGHLRSFHPPKGFAEHTVLDQKNEDISKRGRRVLGLMILWDLRPIGDNKWHGLGYDPRHGVEAMVELQLVSNNTIKMTGCKKIVVSLCENAQWQRQQQKAQKQN